MKKIIMLANDPGGLDVILPVANMLNNNDDMSVKVMLTGSAATIQSQYKYENEEVIKHLECEINKRSEFLLVTGTSWNSTIELDAIGVCKKNGIKTIAILDYWSNYSERFIKNGEYVFPDYYFVMDKLAFDEAEKNGVNSSIMRIIGTPGLDKYIQKNIKEKKVLFLSQPLSELYKDNNDGYTEFDAFEDVLHVCKELNISAYIKFHPKESREMMKLYSHISVEGKIEDIEQDYDVIIGMTTMGLLQCFLRGKSIISYEPHLKNESKSIVYKLGLTKGAFSYIELLNQLKSLIRCENNLELPFWCDGKSTERCVNELINIYEESYE